MKKPTVLEKLSGSLTATAGATALAAYLGGPVAALVPVLSSSLANNRHKLRVSSAISEIENRLSKIENLPALLTDAQYSLINELVTVIINTPDDQKVHYLKEAVFKAPYLETLAMHEAKVLSRALNDISITELSFLIECIGKKIVFNKSKTDGYVNVVKSSPDGERAVGLIALGLLVRTAAEGTASDIGAYEFSPLANRLVGLITE